MREGQIIPMQVVLKGESIPIWYNRHGRNIYILESETALVLEPKCLVLQGPRTSRGALARLEVVPVANGSWLVKWHIENGTYIDDSVFCTASGQVGMTTEVLKHAFGLLDYTNDEFYKVHRWMYDRFGATSARPGTYIRYGLYLNIPGPGTGQNGDPNISIFLSPEIKKAIEKLIAPAE